MLGTYYSSCGYSNDFILLLPEIFLLNGIFILLVYGIIFDKNIILMGKKVILVIVDFSLLLLFFLLILYINSLDINGVIGLYLLVKDYFNCIVLVFITFLNFCYFLVLKNFIRKDVIFNYEYIILLLISFFSVLLLVSIVNFLGMYLVLELQTLCFYVLVSFKQNSDYNTEAGLKYFVLGSFISGFLLFGISLFYGFTGLINFYDIFYYFLDYNDLNMNYFVTIISIFFIIIGLLFKIGAAPFHMWLLDVYSGSCYSFLIYLAIIPKVALFFLLSKLYFIYFNNILIEYNYVFIFSSIVSMLIGTIGGLYQLSVRRLLAYSAVSHVGYILIGFISGNIEGFYGVVIYILIYLIMMFTVLSIFLSYRDISFNSLISNLSSMNSILLNNRILGVFLIIVLFSIGGVPPLIGFFSKLYIYFSIIQEGYYLLSIIIILMSVLGFVYYLRLIKISVFTEVKSYILVEKISFYNAYILVFFSFLGIFFIFYSELFLIFLHNVILYFYL